MMVNTSESGCEFCVSSEHGVPGHYHGRREGVTHERPHVMHAQSPASSGKQTPRVVSCKHAGNIGILRFAPLSIETKPHIPTSSEATIVVCETDLQSIRKTLEQICDVKIKLHFVSIPYEEDWGTLDSLRHIADQIKVWN